MSRAAPLHPGDTVDIAVLAVTHTDIGCRRLDDGTLVNFRGIEGVHLVPGAIATVKVKRLWTYGRPYLSGTVEAVRIDVPALGLPRLKLIALESGEGRRVHALEHPEPGRGKRRRPLLDAETCFATGDVASAIERAWKLLARDLRCLGAHVLLGDIASRQFHRMSAFHFEVGLRIAEQAVGPEFDGIVPWAIESNRPFLRCLYGHAWAQRRLGHAAEARRALVRLLMLDPEDHLGAREALSEVEPGRKKK